MFRRLSRHFFINTARRHQNSIRRYQDIPELYQDSDYHESARLEDATTRSNSHVRFLYMQQLVRSHPNLRQTKCPLIRKHPLFCNRLSAIP